MPDTKFLSIAVSDIFFYTKIRDAFRPQGFTLDRVRTAEDGLRKIRENPPMAIIANMNDDQLDVPFLLRQVRATPETQDIPILAFANHEEIYTWKLAKDLGINKIVSRNEFSARTLPLLEELIVSRAP